MIEGDAYDFPLTQQELGECLGLTSVHINRTLQALRKLKMITVEDRRVTIHDLPGLSRWATSIPTISTWKRNRAD